MPRTFSLASLLLAITLISLLCGLAVNSPVPVPIVVIMFAPAIALSFGLSLFSKQPLVLIFNAVVGAIFGFAVAPQFDAFLNNEDFERLRYLSPTAPAILGVLLAAGSFLLAEAWDRHAQQP